MWVFTKRGFVSIIASIPDKGYQKAVIDAWTTLNKYDLGPGKPHDPEEFMP